MKISHFPDFLPDETVYSVASRYFDRMQFHSHSIVSLHFFGEPTKGALIGLPSNIEHLAQALPPYHLYTVDAIVNRHTLFPLYAPFLSSERALTLLLHMKANRSVSHWIAGIATSRVPRPKWLKYCPACVEYDRSVYGECYWHRLHQVTGVLMCPIHEIMLEDSIVNSRSVDIIAQFYSAESVIDNLSQRVAPAHFHTVLMQLANNVRWLLEQSISTEQGYFQQRYLELLADYNFVTATGNVRYAKLGEAILDYYPTNLLNDLGCGFVGVRNNWLMNWRKMQHPLYHLLLIQFLCQNTQNFFTQTQHVSAPFSNGPWPCLNPLCLHYREQVIMSYAVKQGNFNRPVATFACQCGFTYSRTGPDTNDDAIFRIGRILQFGDVWDQQLTTFWLDQSISTSRVARLMHTDYATIRRQAARLNLPFTPDIPRRGKRPKIYEDFIKQQRDIHRALWKEALEAHSNIGIQKVILSQHKTYFWLKRHDRDWLREHWPTPDLSFRNSGRLVLTKIQRQHEKYSLIDADLAKCVREVSREVYTRSDFPVRLTRQLLITKIGAPVLLNRFKADDILPLTSHALNEVIETLIDFLWRKLRWVVQSCINEQKLPSYEAFTKRARIGTTTLVSPIHKHLVQTAFNSLLANKLLDIPMPALPSLSKTKKYSDEVFLEKFAPKSLAFVCFDKQTILSFKLKEKGYDLISVLLLTVAAVVNGADNCSAINCWSYENEEVLLWLGLPENKFPSHIALKKTYNKVNVDNFEHILDQWLHETFPFIQGIADGVKRSARSTYVPGLRILQPYRHLASQVVAKLR